MDGYTVTAVLGSSVFFALAAFLTICAILLPIFVMLISFRIKQCRDELRYLGQLIRYVSSGYRKEGGKA